MGFVEEQKEEKSKKKKNEEQKVPFYKLFTFADQLDMCLMIGGTLGAIGNGLAQPMMTVIFGQLINSFGTTDPSHAVHEVSKICVKYVYLAIGSGIASYLQMSCWMVTGERQAARIRALYLQTILRQDIAFFDTETTTGEVIGRMSGDTILIQEAMGEKVGKFIQFTSTFLGGFTIAFIKGWRLALVLSSCIPALVIAGGFMALLMSKMSSRGQVAYAQAGNVVEQTIGGIRTVASFTGEKRAIDQYDSKLKIAYKSTVQQGMASGIGLGVILLIVFSTYGLAVWYGGKLILHNGYTGGEVINVLMAIMNGGIALGQTSPSLNAFSSGQAAAYKMFQTIHRKPVIDVYDMSGMELEDMRGEIELKDVYFKYPARKDVQIFAGFSIYIPSGKTAALVGQSGSGKSTIISMLERFYDPDSGEVLLDGVNLKKFKVRWLRQQMGLVSQEPILFATSIKENISYGKENATDAEIRTAIELANAAKFLDKLPQGLDTMVGEHGTQLSGGQKQRIAIARAILKNPKILLLDEATSALDAESERIVQDALDKVMANRTTVVVAHRLTTIRNADLIAVVQTGKLVEQGTHDELIKDPNGAYTQLVKMQQGSKKEEKKELETSMVDQSSVEDQLTRSSSLMLSVLKRSMSHGSSRHSFTHSYPIPGLIDINESEIADQQEDTEPDAKTLKQRKNVSIGRLASLNKPEIPILFLGVLAACFHGVIFPIFGLLLSTVIKIFFEPPPQLKKDSKFWALMYVLLGIATLLAVPIQNFFFGIAGGKLIQRIRSLTFRKVVYQEISWFDDPANSSGAVGARLSTDASTVRSLVGDALALIVQNIATVVAGVIIAFTANWILALVVLVVVPLLGLQGFMQMRLYAGFSADAKKKCEEPVKQGVKVGLISGGGLGLGSLVLYLTNSFCFYIGAVLIEHDLATFPEVFKVFFALAMTATGVSQASAMAPDLNKAKDSATSIFDILDRKPRIDSSSEQGTTLTTVRGDIELEHVAFKYPTRPDIQIFKDMCLTMPAGKTCALVGESGSGKSTVIGLVERFYDPDSGEVFLDGVPIRKLKLSWLRQQMGLVSQEPVLFNETIRNNIAYGKHGNVTEEEIIEAAKSSNAHNFISSLPQGYSTPVGERGTQLSGGQKQRIAIARAILKDPRILLLDEATSALDTQSEHIVQEALDRVMVNRTTVVVAHRLATIKGADLIAVVKNGVIAEKGKHDELLNIKDGVYASLVALHNSST
nr:ABC transporter B family member 9-like [Ipomoea batatas]